MELELIDYIDAEEGRDFAPTMNEQAECDCCGEEVDADARTYQPDWDVFACPACIRECEAQLAEEEWARECSCRRTAVDEYDNRGCIVHDRRAA